MTAKHKHEAEASDIEALLGAEVEAKEPELTDGWLPLTDDVKDGRVVLLTGDGARFVSAQWHPTRTYDTKQMKWVETGFWKLARVSVDGREVVFGVQKVPFAPIAYRLPS